MSGQRIRLGSIPCNALDVQFPWPDGFNICQLINNGTDVVFIKPYTGSVDTPSQALLSVSTVPLRGVSDHASHAGEGL